MAYKNGTSKHQWKRVSQSAVTNWHEIYIYKHTFQDGVYIKGLYLQGAGWDKKNQCLIEATPMQLVCQIPTIHFKPVENKKKVTKGIIFHQNVDGKPSSGLFISCHLVKSNKIDGCGALSVPNVLLAY